MNLHSNSTCLHAYGYRPTSLVRLYESLVDGCICACRGSEGQQHSIRMTGVSKSTSAWQSNLLGVLILMCQGECACKYVLSFKSFFLLNYPGQFFIRSCLLYTTPPAFIDVATLPSKLASGHRDHSLLCVYPLFSLLAC